MTFDLWGIYFKDPATHTLYAMTSSRHYEVMEGVMPVLFARRENAEKVLRGFKSSPKRVKVWCWENPSWSFSEEADNVANLLIVRMVVTPEFV